jgi:hypothetical protein
MSSISDRGDSPAFFNEDGSLHRKEDSIWYRDESGAIVFKSQSTLKTKTKIDKKSSISDLI